MVTLTLPAVSVVKVGRNEAELSSRGPQNCLSQGASCQIKAGGRVTEGQRGRWVGMKHWEWGLVVGP